MKKVFAITLMAGLVYLSSCGGGDETTSDDFKMEDTATAAPASTTPASADAYDPKRGEGKWDASNVDVSSFDAGMAAKGKLASDAKCASCHKTTDEKLVGPGWAGVTKRRTPEWIMNFITNPDPMIDKDPEVQAQLELCLVRMPNQSLADEEARSILEYMRELDGNK